jgi:hypothetical protein
LENAFTYRNAYFDIAAMSLPAAVAVLAMAPLAMQYIIT